MLFTLCFKDWISLDEGDSLEKKSECTVDFIDVSMHLAGYFKAHYCNFPFARLAKLSFISPLITNQYKVFYKLMCWLAGWLAGWESNL
jgi:hypothetical protein